MTEFVHLNTARAMVSAAYLMNSPTLKTQIWRNASATIVFPNGQPSFGSRCIAQLSSSQDLSNARILWDPGRASWSTLEQNPASGNTVGFVPFTTGDQRTLQAEAVLPDGRRVFATNSFSIWDPVNGGTNSVTDGNTVALYHFDNTNAPFADSSTNAYTLTAHGSVVLANNANWMRNPTGRVARFRGAGDYLEITNIPDAAILPSSSASLTIDARIYPRAWKTDSGNNAQFVISLKQDSDTQWVLYYDPRLTPRAPQFYANCCSMLSNSDLNSLLTLNTWHQLTVTLSTNGVTSAYIDGLLRTNVTFAPSYGRASDWTLHLGDFDGDIDEVRISNTARPQ